MIGERIKQRRQVLGLSLQDIADRMSGLGETITRAGLSKYENDKSMPKAQFIWNLAKVLGVSSDYFFADNTVSIEWLAFRKNSALSRKTEEMVKSYASEYMQGMLFLESIMYPEVQGTVVTKTAIRTPDEAEKVAQNLRREWELNSWPIESMTQLLEAKGFYVVEEQIDDRKFDGLSGVVNGKSLLIISRTGISVDRKRFNLAHELGHHFIEAEDDLKEQSAHVFASAFLIPSETLYSELGTSRKNVDVKELLLLKEKYGISIQALTRRCRDLGIISDAVYQQMFIYFRSQYWHVSEPGTCSHREEPARFKKMILKAVAESVIPAEKANAINPGYSEKARKEMNSTSWKWNDLLNLPPQERERALKAAAEAAENDYREGSELRSFETGGDIYDETM